MMHVALLLLLLKLTVASPQRIAAPEAELGIEFESDDTSGLPLLKLPYGTWRAYQHDSENDVSPCTTTSIMRGQKSTDIPFRYIPLKIFALLLRRSDLYDLQLQHRQYLILPLFMTVAMVPFADKVRRQADSMFWVLQMSIR